MAVMKQFAEDYARRDMTAVLSHFAPDNDLVLYATEADEKRIGLEGIKLQLERDWSRTEALSIKFNWTSISSAGDVAWAATDTIFKAKVKGNDLLFPFRSTMVFEKRLNKWLIVHGHFSFPDEKINLWQF
jgi:ketosteroid isomerase-like protein